MDPISIASGIVSLSASAFKLAVALDQLIEDCKAVDEEMTTLQAELRNLSAVLKRLQNYVEGPGLSSVLPRDLIMDLGPIIQATKATFLRLEDLFHRLQKGGLGMVNRFRWVYNAKDMSKLKTDLSAHKLTLNMTLTMVTW